MTHRDRAWRRRMNRIVTHRDGDSQDWLGDRPTDHAGKPFADLKQHQPGKLTPAQNLRQDWQLRDDAMEGFSSDRIV